MPVCAKLWLGLLNWSSWGVKLPQLIGKFMARWNLINHSQVGKFSRILLGLKRKPVSCFISNNNQWHTLCFTHFMFMQTANCECRLWIHQICLGFRIGDPPSLDATVIVVENLLATILWNYPNLDWMVLTWVQLTPGSAVVNIIKKEWLFYFKFIKHLNCNIILYSNGYFQTDVFAWLLEICWHFYHALLYLLRYDIKHFGETIDHHL